MALPSSVGLPKASIFCSTQRGSFSSLLLSKSLALVGNKCSSRGWIHNKRLRFQSNSLKTISSSSRNEQQPKLVWIWTENKQVMTTAVERGWNTFLFTSQNKQLANDWSSMAMICPLFIENGGIFDNENRRIAGFREISSPEQLSQFQSVDEEAENAVIDLLDWQVIPAENIVAAFQETQKTVFAISETPSEAQTFFEALELGLGGVVLKVEDVDAVLEMKEYIDRRNEMGNLLSLTKATITRVQTVGMGDRVCVDLCSLMKPGEGLLVGSFARGLYLVHSECLESNYIASRPFRVNAEVGNVPYMVGNGARVFSQSPKQTATFVAEWK
ncbi:3-dehydroquinate synthase [Thalictrum thalictroides]|uniref:3-dehydroquinate synthase n=1 Tax=Thalictrum thalictroides TaxID=46969 RepID=A0A7J6W2B7_THATH|nr:3-dehydroquinate synthase [Thalictrum thalictroides]